MKQLTVLIVLLVVGHVESYAHDSNETPLSEVGRKRLLVNLLHALRTLRDHKKVKSTSITFPKFDNVDSDTEHHTGSASYLVPPITNTIDDVQTIRLKNQISKRSKGIHKESKGTHDKRLGNGKELFLQLLQTLKSIKTRKNEKRGRRINLSKEHEKHMTRITQKIKENVPTSLPRPHNRNTLPDFDQRSSVLKPVKQLAKIGTSQTNKARYSFTQARLSFLQALETAQDEKLTKLGNLEKKFSYILPKGEENNHQNVGKEVQYALQDFTKDQSATALSQIHRPYKDLFSKPSQSATPTKHSLLGEPLKKQSSSSSPNSLLPIPASIQNGIENKGKIVSTANVELRSTNKSTISEKIHSRTFKKRKELFLDELLSISNAHNKLEKLKRLQRLKEKLLHHFSEDNTMKEDYGNTLHDNKDKNVPSFSYQAKINRPITRKVVNNASHMKNYKIYNERQRPNKEHNKNFSIPGQGLPDKVGSINQEHIAKPFEYADTFEDFVTSTKDKKEPTHSTFGYTNHGNLSTQSGNSLVSYSNNENNTVQDKQDKMANVHLGGMPVMPLNVNQSQSRYQYSPGLGNKTISLRGANRNSTSSQNTNDELHHDHPTLGDIGQDIGHIDNPAQHIAPKYGNTAITSLPGKISNSTSTLSTNSMKDKDDDHHRNFGNTAILQKQQTENPGDLSQPVVRNHSNSHDINIIGTAQQTPEYLSTKNQKGSESDHSYLPLDSSATAPQTESEDFKNPLSSVVSEHDKIISELTTSKALSKHLSNDKNEKSHKTLSKILQKAQNMFLKKVKEILAGNKTNGKENINTNLDGNKNRENASQKPKGGVINTSAYVMDESPQEEKTAAKVSQDNSGIVPKTPTNDDLLNSVNRNVAQPAIQQQNAGTNAPMQSLQTPMDPNPPLQAQSVGQPGQGHPMSGQPLTYAQLQDAHEEETVALQQENAFRSMQPGVNAPLSNGANTPLNSATTSYQRYMGSNQLPQTNHYTIQNPGFHAPDVDDLSEYTGGMERYQLSHHIGYDGDIDDENGDDYLPKRHRFHLYGHHIDDEDDEDYDDDNDDDDDFDEEGEKKSSIGKPRRVGKKKHLKKHHFRKSSNSTKIEHIKYEKVHGNRKNARMKT